LGKKGKRRGASRETRKIARDRELQKKGKKMNKICAKPWENHRGPRVPGKDPPGKGNKKGLCSPEKNGGKDWKAESPKLEVP